VPYPNIKRVYLVSIDGCRPDVLLRANCPNYRALTRNGAFTFWCRSTALSITLPTHTSMLTGVPPRTHGIEWNRDLPLSEPVYPKVATIFDILKKLDVPTACIAGKSKFDAIAGRPGTVTYQYLSP
jgi:arylsulfatase A-like enzyme